MSCGVRPEHHGIFASVQCGDIVTVRRAMMTDPSLLNQATPYDRHSVLHVAAASGQIEVSLLRDLNGISTESGGFGFRFAGIFSIFFWTSAFLIFADFVFAVGEIHESGYVESSQAGLTITSDLFFFFFVDWKMEISWLCLL